MNQIEGKIIIIEAGGSKTNLVWRENQEVKELVLAGFNPNRPERQFLIDLNTIAFISPRDEIYFYGSGCSTIENKEYVSSIFMEQFGVKVVVYDDLIGGARALLGAQSGMFAILGTGAACAFFDGKEIVARTGAYGYLIDDIGGGLELGKVVVSYWLNNRLNPLLEKKISNFLQTTKEAFIPLFYKEKNLSQLSELTKVIVPFIQDTVVHQLLLDYFSIFFVRHIAPLKTKFQVNNLYLGGSISWAFKEVLIELSVKYNLNLIWGDQFPAKKLLDFHQNKI
jgi:N-acetylglucosamine kinase-like BadF-type ATPase